MSLNDPRIQQDEQFLKRLFACMNELEQELICEFAMELAKSASLDTSAMPSDASKETHDE